MKKLTQLLCGAAALGSLTMSVQAQPVKKPNLLIIQTDEHNFRTLGCYRQLLSQQQAFPWGAGVKVDTPNIDWLAQNGALAEHYYATSPVCTPSRASFVSGFYPQNTGASNNNKAMTDNMVTFGEVLQRNGYQTGYLGKWHLDGNGKPQFGPERKFGFDNNPYMFNRGHWKKLVEDENGPRVGAVNAQGKPTYALDGADEKTFTTDFLTDRTIEFIKAKKADPFCVYLSIPDPHGPDTVRAPYDTMFAGLDFKQPRTALLPGTDLPDYASTENAKMTDAKMSQYFGMVKCIDDNVGRILTTLRQSGVLERTFIVFTSDHGDMLGEHGRVNKSIPLDGSARIAFLLHAPGAVKPGTVVREALGTVDFKPTMLGLMGIENSADQGRDASALFRQGKAPANWKDVTFLRLNNWMGAFTSQYKFVVAPDADPVLLDHKNDPDELTNLLNSPSIARRCARWRAN